jgi:hypothetical protein
MSIAETKFIIFQCSFVLIHDFTHSSLQHHKINTLAAFYIKIPASRFFSSNHFCDRNKNIISYAAIQSTVHTILSAPYEGYHMKMYAKGE